MRNLLLVLLMCGSVFGTIYVVASTDQRCGGVFLDPNEVLVVEDPTFLSDPNNQIRLYERLRTGQKLNLIFNACDPDGDPVGETIPYIIPDDLAFAIDGNQVAIQYHAKGQSKRDIAAFVLTDAPVDPNVTPSARIAAIIIDVHKNRAPVWK